MNGSALATVLNDQSMMIFGNSNCVLEFKKKLIVLSLLINYTDLNAYKALPTRLNRNSSSLDTTKPNEYLLS